LEEVLRMRADKGDKSAKRKLHILADDQYERLMNKAKEGDKDALSKLKLLFKDYKERAAAGDQEAANKAD
jgi:hypothetical protein